MCWLARSMFWILLCAKGAWCLRMIALKVYPRVVVGDTIHLNCIFDPEQDKLFSIKWYREDTEFFRYIPFDEPELQYFPMQGVNVNMERSAKNFVVLDDIDETTSGKFKCEVSTGAPRFVTEVAEAELRVQELDDSSACRASYGLLPLLLVLLRLFVW